MASLRIKILLILVLFLCAVGSVSFGVGSYLFNQSLVDFEQRATASQLARVETGFVQDVDALVRITVDNALWPYGFGFNLLIGGLFFWVAVRRLTIPYGVLPKGTRVA